jgi:hypothetical protein
MESNIIVNSQKDWKVLEFFVPIKETFQDEKDFLIRGTAINETTTLNNIKYVADELEKAAPSFRNVPILLDHVNEVKNIVGRTTNNVEFNPSFRRIDFEGKIMDNTIKEMIKDGRIQSVSIGAKVEDLMEEDDGSLKAIGLKGLELSLVAVPGDSHANFGQALQNSFYLKEKAKLNNVQNMNEKEVKIMEEKIEVKEETSKETLVENEEASEEVIEEEKAEEKVSNINIKVDNSEINEMRKTIDELKEILLEKKKIKEEAEKMKVDETKGEVTNVEEAISEDSSVVVERAKEGFALYKDYSKENSDTKLKRLVR